MFAERLKIATLSDRLEERLIWYLIVYQSFSERCERSDNIVVVQRISAVFHPFSYIATLPSDSCTDTL